MRVLGIYVLQILFAAAAFGQTIGQNAHPNNSSVATFTVQSQLVTEAVTVKDAAGKSVPHLTANDFTVTENGVPQKVRFCEHQTLPTAITPLPALKSDDVSITVYRTLDRPQIATEPKETLHYRDHRLLALYFDLSAMDPSDQYRALVSAKHFIRTQMTAADLISILRFDNGSVDVLQDFTADRNRLLSILNTMQVGEIQEWRTGNSDTSAVDTGAAFGQDNSEFNIFNTDRQLSALQTAAEMLGRLTEKKALIYFAGGLQLNGIDNQAQLHATVDTAIRAGVSFWPIDARGLVADAPLGDATQGSPGGASMYTGTAQEATQSAFSQSQDTLFALAADTGGKALLDTNDLTRGITQAQSSISDYYILGYYTSNTTPDGRFRRIKITVDRPAKLDYREGYYAPKVFAKFNDADKERQLEDALMLEDPITDLTIAMELDYFQLNRAEYFVPLTVKIPGSELALAKHGGADQTVIDFIGEIKDVYGGDTISNVRDHLNIKLSGETEAELAHVPMEYESGFTLIPGRYKIKLLARDYETGRIGTFETAFTIPNLNDEQQRVPISSVILSAQRMKLQEAAYNALKSKAEATEASVNPLVANGSELIPSVTQVFNRSQSLHVYLQGYEPSDNARQPLMAYVTLYRHGKLQLLSALKSSFPSGEKSITILPFNFDIPLAALDPGTYICQVSVLGVATGKSSYWRAPIVISK